MYFQASEVAYCGDAGGALRLLRRALDGGYSIYPAMDTNPFFESLRRDPRWAAVRADAIRYRDELNAQLLAVDRAALR